MRQIDRVVQYTSGTIDNAMSTVAPIVISGCEHSDKRYLREGLISGGCVDLSPPASFRSCPALARFLSGGVCLMCCVG